ncbi:hypothetical protein [Polyangium sp. 15x6]|uniref:hypothetical protein n=1 Tax=Polyangium sp. 15x6 TaxID=3042687 RepID=UPI00249B16CC|nr:hypothetical protein [Polyangium sp. 15x6]MDI3284833.1 hypothetical protein [Polyangium sp. 15x6]
MNGSGNANVGARQRSNAIVGAVRKGDIMIKHRHGLGAVGVGIKVGQLFSRGNSDLIHAGVASSATTIVEMDGHGLQENNLLTTNAQFTYDVFRCRDENLAAGAGETAIMMREGMAAGGFNIQYTVGGAFGSLLPGSAAASSNRINGTLDQLLAGNAQAFFCSGHVVYCYLAAMEQLHIATGQFSAQRMREYFSLEAVDYNPSFLQQHLARNRHFVFVGRVRGARLI